MTAATQEDDPPPGFRMAGTGLTVFQEDEPVEGPARWLDSPQTVIEFVAGDDVQETIVVVRGGTTTFLAPALSAGVRGVITLQGAPESHLGILAREYGIPCLMAVAFERGVRSARGETVPADGARLRMDISSSPRGGVFMEEGAPTAGDGDERAAAPDAPAPPDPEQAAQIQRLLERYGGEVPHGVEGDEQMRSGLSTSVLELTEESVQRDLTDEEVNDHHRYLGWNLWDILAARGTEGESGLIPRQEYESFAFVQVWQRYPEFLRLITEEVGVDGLYEIGATARREVGTKVNLLHNWAIGSAPGFGRGVSLGLGIHGPGDRAGDLRDAVQFARRVYRGMWDGGAMFTSMRGYTAPLLDDKWITRLRDECIPLTDPEERARHQRFSASTELMGFLLHFDNRAGLSDTGPYPLEDGGFMIVRDHFLSDDVYHWADLASDLPHAVTQAMVFKPDADLSVAVVDIGTLFTKPANYLKHLTGMAVYARDRWDTPVSDIRRLDDAEIDRIQATCDEACVRLYRRIAAMPRRDKIMAGAQVYYTDFILPYARLAGVWDRLKDEHDFFELDPVAAKAYYELVRDDAAAELIPRLFLTGTGFPALETEEADR